MGAPAKQSPGRDQPSVSKPWNCPYCGAIVMIPEGFDTLRVKWNERGKFFVVELRVCFMCERTERPFASHEIPYEIVKKSICSCGGGLDLVDHEFESVGTD